MKKLSHIFEKNEAWARAIMERDPDFFHRLSAIQRPEYLWIGCSDSRVPANQITGLVPGQIFVHRNVGNIVGSTDLNCISVLQYAVEVLNIRHIIVTGHYGCGAVQAVWENRQLGLIDYWLSSIERVRDANVEHLNSLYCPQMQMDRLCELNVIEQAKNVCNTSIVRDAWAQGKELTVHGWIYGLDNGRLKDLEFCVSSLAEFSAWAAPALVRPEPAKDALTGRLQPHMKVSQDRQTDNAAAPAPAPCCRSKPAAQEPRD